MCTGTQCLIKVNVNGGAIAFGHPLDKFTLLSITETRFYLPVMLIYVVPGRDS